MTGALFIVNIILPIYSGTVFCAGFLLDGKTHRPKREAWVLYREKLPQVFQ